MEHLTKRWVARLGEDGAWEVVTDEAHGPWFVAAIPHSLPDDKTGEKTAKELCRLHNIHIGVAP